VVKSPVLSSHAAARSLVGEGTDIVYQRRARALFSHLPVAVLPIVVGWSVPWNLPCVGLLLAYTAVGLVSTRRYNASARSEAQARSAARWLYVNLAALGFIYNTIFMNLARHDVPHAMDYLLLLTSLFCAGGAATYQYLRGLAIVFIVSATVPQIGYYLLAGGEGVTTALLLVVFIVFMSNTSLSLHRDAVERLSLIRQLQEAKDQAENLARTDALSGLLNRRALIEMGAGLVAGALRHEQPLSVVMLDIDRFKAINDHHGHAAGDAAIVAVAQAMGDAKRSSDVAGRLGGEEFLVVLPNTPSAAAGLFAERLRNAIRNHTVEHGGQRINLTVSLGVAQLGAHDAGLADVMQRADRALYEAKDAGRDRSVVSSASVGAPSLAPGAPSTESPDPV
jgi:diguanylate cyclase (GGDEF)-like protein